MELTLTDRLTCPRCGPTFGLILLANRLVDRRVHDGVLGCPNCRDSFPIADGFADLRAPPRGELERGLAGPERVHVAENAGVTDGGGAARVIALLGIPSGPGTVALVGAPAALAGALTDAVEDLQVVAVDPDAHGWPERQGVSRLASRPGLPFFGRVLRGVVVDARLGPAILFEAARVTAPMSRVVVLYASQESTEVLRRAGLEILAEEGETVVAVRG